MPRISAFYGISIRMYYDETEHRGRPHFHAIYGDAAASIDIDTVEVIAGWLPPRARRLTQDWARAHQPELREAWDRRAHTRRRSPSNRFL